MSFGDRFRVWQENQRLNQYFGGTTPTTMWPDDWYLGRNIGLKRWQALQLVPGVGGAAASILAGRGGNTAAAQRNGATGSTTATDYTPFLILGGAVVLYAILKK